MPPPRTIPQNNTTRGMQSAEFMLPVGVDLDLQGSNDQLTLALQLLENMRQTYGIIGQLVGGATERIATATEASSGFDQVTQKLKQSWQELRDTTHEASQGMERTLDVSRRVREAQGAIGAARQAGPQQAAQGPSRPAPGGGTPAGATAGPSPGVPGGPSQILYGPDGEILARVPAPGTPDTASPPSPPSGAPGRQPHPDDEQQSLQPDHRQLAGLTQLARVIGSVRSEAGGQILSGIQSAGPLGRALARVPGIQNILGMGAGGRAAAGIGGMAIAAPIAAAFLGYETYQQLAGLGQRYTQVTGGTSVTQAIGYEARTRLMALSPFISSDQARQIVMGTLSAGYTGTQADTVMDFLAGNVRRGVMNVADSMKLWRVAMDEGGAGVQGVTRNLDDLQKTATETQASVQEMAQNVLQQTQVYVAQGAGGNAPGIAALWAQAGAASGNPLIRGYAGPDINNLMFRSLLASRLGVNPLALSGALASRTEPQTALAEQGAINQVIASLPGLPSGVGRMSGQDLIKQSPMMLQFWGQQLESYGIIPQGSSMDAQYVADFITETVGGRIGANVSLNRLQSRYATRDLYPARRQELLHKLFPNAVSDLSKTAWLRDPRSPNWRQIETEGSDFEGFVRAEEVRRGQYTPLLERLISTGDYKDAWIRDPKSGQMTLLTDYYQRHPRDLFSGLMSGDIQVAMGRHHRGGGIHMLETYREQPNHPDFSTLAGLYDAPRSAGSGRYVVELGPMAQQFFRLLDPSGYYPPNRAQGQYDFFHGNSDNNGQP